MRELTIYFCRLKAMKAAGRRSRVVESCGVLIQVTASLPDIMLHGILSRGSSD